MLSGCRATDRCPNCQGDHIGSTTELAKELDQLLNAEPGNQESEIRRGVRMIRLWEALRVRGYYNTTE